MPRRSDTPPEPPAAVVLASVLRSALAKASGFTNPDMIVQTSGVIEPGALFDVTDDQGRTFRIRVNRNA